MIHPSEFDSVVRALRPQLVRCIGRLVGEADAEDVVQLALTNAASALTQFRGESSPRTWLFRIATNAAHDWNRAHRGAHRQPIALDGPEVPDTLDLENTSQERQLLRAEMSQCVGELFRRLPENYQTVLALSDCEQLTDREVALVLEISEGAAKIRLHRARGRMKAELDRACSFYRDAENTLCCDRKEESTNDAYPFPDEPRQQVGRRMTGGDPQPNSEDFVKNTQETLPSKTKHLIGVGAAIASGCRPCTLSYVAAAQAAGACERGLWLALEAGLAEREAASNAIAAFASESFQKPELDASFRSERAQLVALIAVSAAIASNAAPLIAPRVAAARACGVTDAQIHAAVQIARTAKRGAERATEAALSAVVSDTAGTLATPCPCEGTDPPSAISAQAERALS